MKKIFLLILLGLVNSLNLSAQCTCDFQVEMVQDPANFCCFDVNFCHNGGPDCNLAAVYGPLTISSNGNSNSTATIASVTSANTGIVTASQQGNYQAVFSSNFIALGFDCNPTFYIGRICLDSAPNSAVSFSAVIGQPGGPCDIPITDSMFMVPATCSSPAGLFEKICGDDFDNRPTAIKAFGDGIYVSGYNASTNQEFGTFKKYDILSGALVWQKQLLVKSRIVDFEYDPTNDEFLLVGWSSPPPSTIPNQSLLLKMDDSGNLVPISSKSFDQTGREEFTRIVLHPNPIDPAYPYYILGRKNPTSTPSSNDVVVVHNIDALGNTKTSWPIEYASGLNSPTDDEFFLGLIPTSDGNLILTGLIINNDGILVEIDGLTGTAAGYRFFGQALDIYDGIELSPGRLAIVGENWATRQAFVAVLQKGPVNGGPIGYSAPFGNTPILEFPNISNFKDIWTDQYGKLYVIGENKNMAIGKNYQVVHKLNYFTHAGSADLSVDWAKYLEDLLFAETNYSNGVISVTPGFDNIFYADSRKKVIPFFGDQDMVVGAYDLDLLSACEFPFPFPTVPLVLTADSINISSTNFTAPTLNPPQVQDLDLCCTDIWNSSICTADFSWALEDCFEVQFTAISSTCVLGTYTYDWDFGDGSPIVQTNSPIINHTFPCGGGFFTVCVAVTDPFGCVATICKTVQVDNCQGCTIPTPSLFCNPNNFDAFDFTIALQHMIPFTFCSYTVTSLTPGVVLSAPSSTLTTITGTATVTTWPTPTVLNLNIAMNCICPQPGGGTYICDVPVSIPTKCCKQIDVPLPIACEDDDTLDVQIQAFGTLCNITRVTWYTQDKQANGTCPTSYWGGKPYQDNPTSVLEPLHLYPSQMNGDLCVYAEVLLDDGPCTILTTNIACVELCAPTTCTLQNDQDFCYTGTPITPAPLTVTFNSPPNACFPTIQWLDPAGNVVQQGGTTYIPTQSLSITNPLIDCYEDFFYSVVITDFCGTRDCKARIRLYSDDAPKGTLTVLPLEANTLCPNESVVLNFTPGCDSFDLADPQTWTWHTRPCDPAGACTPVPNSGTMNANWSTNILTTSVYYYVETQNGVCPIDSVQLLLEVKEPLEIILFDAIPDPCVEQQVDLSLTWKPCMVAGCPPGTACSPCSHTIEWYKGCTIVGITNEPAGSTSSSFTHTSPPLAGNYYAVVKDDCCPNNSATSQVVEVFPSCEPVIAGPCFICENETVMLMDMSVIPPNTSCPYFCGYTWSTVGGNIVGPSNTSVINVDAPGTYTMTTSCVLNGQVCVKSTSYTLIRCQRAVSGAQECGIVAVEEPLLPETRSVHLYPNPTTGEFVLEINGYSLKDSKVNVINPQGRTIQSTFLDAGEEIYILSIVALPAGIYFIEVKEKGMPVWIEKIIKL